MRVLYIVTVCTLRELRLLGEIEERASESINYEVVSGGISWSTSWARCSLEASVVGVGSGGVCCSCAWWPSQLRPLFKKVCTLQQFPSVYACKYTSIYTRVVLLFIDFLKGIPGSILFNWKGKVRNGGELTNWTGSADPCARNSSWFRVSCNTDGFVQQM
jgi:hypothetical protein